MKKIKSDIEIVQEHTSKPIIEIAKKATIKELYLEQYGKDKAKIDLKINDELNKNEDGHLVLVTAITPTKAGEGKTTTTIGVGDALSLLNKKTIITLREPSLGPVFGIKGGAAGGGYSQVVPMEDINLHFTGDLHAITSANNLVSAMIDNHLHFGNELQIDKENIVWKRAMDMNDRSLRNIRIGYGKTNGPEREDGFQITVATEIMAIMCLSKDLEDFKEKVAKCIVAYDINKKPVTIEDLKIVDALAILMKDALKPNLVQTLGETPVLMHGGPFANIAHGCNSLIATKMALKLSDFVVTEAGFGADLGAEKFLNIKCQEGNLKTSFVVIVATIRALKLHGGVDGENLGQENIEALKNGFENLLKHVENIQQYKLPFLVAINKFPTDTKKETDTLKMMCEELKIPVFLSEVYEKGGAGAQEIAKYIIKNAKKTKVQSLYNKEVKIKDKIFKIATTMYGAKTINYSEKALEQIEFYEKLGFNNAYICMAKTPNSLSDDAKVLGRPRDFEINIKEVRLSAGANFIIPLTGSIMIMPGLAKNPAAKAMTINKKGKIKGLF